MDLSFAGIALIINAMAQLVKALWPNGLPARRKP